VRENGKMTKINPFKIPNNIFLTESAKAKWIYQDSNFRDSYILYVTNEYAYGKKNIILIKL
jgi:hypothetical protein